MRKKNWNKIYENSGRLFLDLGKLSFASFIFGTIIKGEIDKIWLFLFGFFASVIFLYADFV
ncbi:MAG: hypothetical protein LBG72_07950 [Spirochaetaceae bacterium]|jgi:hypothetical protein|nr:hypothetical protein [Spirochaetaceae bacterium]